MLPNLGFSFQNLQEGLLNFIVRVSLEIGRIMPVASTVQRRLDLLQSTRFLLQLVEMLLLGKVFPRTRQQNDTLASVEFVGCPHIINRQHVLIGLERKAAGMSQFVEGVF